MWVHRKELHWLDWLTHPDLRSLYVFSSFPPSLLQLQRLLLLTSKPFGLKLRYSRQRKYMSGEMYQVAFLWPWPKSQRHWLTKNAWAAKWEPLIHSSNNVYHLITYWRNSVGTFSGIFFKIADVFFFFKVKHSTCHILGMVGPIDMKRKGTASVRYWVNYVTFDLPNDLDLEFVKGKGWNSII